MENYISRTQLHGPMKTTDSLLHQPHWQLHASRTWQYSSSEISSEFTSETFTKSMMITFWPDRCFMHGWCKVPVEVLTMICSRICYHYKCTWYMTRTKTGCGPGTPADGDQHVHLKSSGISYPHKHPLNKKIQVPPWTSKLGEGKHISQCNV